MNFILAGLAFFFYNTLSAQSFKIGTSDIYGNRAIKSGTVYAHLSVKAGDSISHESFRSADEAKKLEQIPGIKYATVNPVCCDTSGNLMIFIGIGETDSAVLKLRKAPLEDIRMPDEMIKAYNDFNDQIEPAIKSGNASEDYSHGYSLMNYIPARNEQYKFITFAGRNFTLLSNVLKSSRYDEQREASAQIIAYSLNRKMVVKDLLYAIYDPDEIVRNNATRALGILAGYVIMHPELKITIPAEPFIKMMNSIVWTDRNKGANVLMQLTKSRDPKLLNEIKQQPLPSVIEMAKWKDRGHAFYSFVILGRIAGVEEKSLLPGNYSAGWSAKIDSMVEKCSR